jgi:hypothetical protein
MGGVSRWVWGSSKPEAAAKKETRESLGMLTMGKVKKM